MECTQELGAYPFSKDGVYIYIYIYIYIYMYLLYAHSICEGHSRGCHTVSRMELVPYGRFYDTRSGRRDVNYWALWKRRNVYYKLRSSTN